MRKKQGRLNHRKFHIFSGRRPSADETDWFLLEAEVGAVSARPATKVFRHGWLIRLLAVGCLCLSIPIGAKWVHDRVFYRNTEFVLQEIDVETDGSLSDENLKEIANVTSGLNLMELDLDDIRGRIEKLAIVEEAIVTREMPDRLAIRVRERKPVAWISCPPLGIRPGDMERGYLVDASGILFRCLDLTSAVESLPLIETFRMTEPKEGDRFSVDGARGALQFLARAHVLSKHEGMEPRVVRLRSEWSLQCEFSGGSRVVFADHEVKRGLSDLRVILNQAEELNTKLVSANVAARDNIPVVFSDIVDPAIAAEPATPLVDAGSAAPEDDRQKHLQSILKGG